MKRIVIGWAVLVLSGAVGGAAEPVDVVPFTVVQKSGDEWAETIYFKGGTASSVRLEGFTWAGSYVPSPDFRWLLRIQKTGSGDNIGILYHVESGHVSQVADFNAQLWAASDAHSPIPSRALYHTGIEAAKWDAKSATLRMTVRGSAAMEAGKGLECRISYDVKGRTFTVEHTTAKIYQPR